MTASTKKAFVLRIDEQMLEAIERWAADEFRSTNGQMEYLLAEALRKAKRMPKKGSVSEVSKNEAGTETI